MSQAFTSLALPPSFISHNDEDAAWLEALPDLLDRLVARWSITLAPHFPDIRINYVAPATRADNTACVLKLSRHVEETRNEIAALQLWDGDGAVRLLDADPDLGALLLERLHPGTMLSQVSDTDDDAATVIAAGISRGVWSMPCSTRAGTTKMATVGNAPSPTPRKRNCSRFSRWRGATSTRSAWPPGRSGCTPFRGPAPG